MPAIYFWTGSEHLFDYYGLVAYKNFFRARNRVKLTEVRYARLIV